MTQILTYDDVHGASIVIAGGTRGSPDDKLWWHQSLSSGQPLVPQEMTKLPPEQLSDFNVLYNLCP